MVARATSIPDRDRRAPDDQARVRPRPADEGCRDSRSRTSGRVGGLLEAKKIAGMAEAHYAQIAPHLYCGPDRRRRATSSSRRAARTSSSSRGSGAGTGSTRELLTPADPLGRRLRDPADRAGPGVEARRGGRAPPPVRGRRAASDARGLPGRLMRVAFVGVGRLGGHLAASLLRAGFDALCARPRPVRGTTPPRTRVRTGRIRRRRQPAGQTRWSRACPRPTRWRQSSQGASGVLTSLGPRRDVDRHEHQRSARASPARRDRWPGRASRRSKRR